MDQGSSDDGDDLPRPPPTDPGMFVSHWDDDAGIEEEEHPHSCGEKEVLWAAENGDMPVLRKLLLSDPELVNVHDKDGYTPLHRACYSKHHDAAELLIEHGADLESRTVEGWTPLHSAARWNSCVCMRLLIRHGVNINATTHGDLTPLMIAASNIECGDACFILLCQPGIKSRVINNAGDTASDIASRTVNVGKLFELAESYLDDW